VRFAESVGRSPRPGGERSPQTPQPRFLERHFSVRALAEIWGLSPDSIQKLFDREPGVLVIGNDGSRSKRGYHTLRIPESVAERVHRRMCNPDLTPERPRAYPSSKAGPPVGVNN
jgi:hypothetical protein